jgi:hypothetical protein
MSTTQSGFPRTIATAPVPGGPIGNIAVPGIRAGDQLISVVQMTSGLVRTDRFANASIPGGSEGRIAMSAVDTSGSWLVVTWLRAQ